MNKPKYDKKSVELFLKNKKISTLQDLKKIVGTDVDMTVFRILKGLSYRSSYSHGGRYYTLDTISEFDENGLWNHNSVCFSGYGNLLSTLEHFASSSKSGFFSGELGELLNVGVKESLLRLLKKGRVCRERVSGAYLYCSPIASVRKKQVLSRQVRQADAEDLSDGIKAAIIIFVSMLDEQQQRLFAGLEALKLGHGGDHRIAELLGLHYQTVARGRRELVESEVAMKRTRKAGAGRKQVEKKRQT